MCGRTCSRRLGRFRRPVRRDGVSVGLFVGMDGEALGLVDGLLLGDLVGAFVGFVGFRGGHFDGLSSAFWWARSGFASGVYMACGKAAALVPRGIWGCCF